MDISPNTLVFRDIHLNQSYTSSLCISNPWTTSVEFTLRPSSSRYVVTPNRVALSSGQSIVVTVRLFLSHFPNYSKGIRGQEDTIHVKSTYFEQNVNMTFFLHDRGGEANSSQQALTRSRSSSPSGRGAGGGLSTRVPRDTLVELQQQLASKDEKTRRLEGIITQLESKYPSVQEIVKSKVEQERIVYEEKSEKALKLLQHKDELIEYLQNQLSESTEILRSSREAKQAQGGGGGGDGSEDGAEDEGKRAFLSSAAQDKKSTAMSGRRGSNNAAAGKGGGGGGGSGGEGGSGSLTYAQLMTHVANLEQLLKDSRNSHQLEAQEHLRCQRRLEEATAGGHNNRASSSSSSSSVGGYSPGIAEQDQHYQQQQQQELRGLRERVVDQVEQIDVLVAEVAHLRSEAFAENNASLAQEEIARLQKQLAQERNRVKELVAENEAFRISSNEQRRRDLEQEQLFSPMLEEEKEKQDLMQQFSSSSSAALGAPGAGGGEGGGRAVAQHTQQNESLLLQERAAQTTLVKEQVDKLSKDNAVLRVRLEEAAKLERQLRQETMSQQLLIAASQQDTSASSKQAMEEKDGLLRDALEKLAKAEKKGTANDAHLWWAYVWHELKREERIKHTQTYKLDVDAHSTNGAADGPDLQMVCGHLRETLRVQAVEITNLRQDLLRRKLYAKKELETLQAKYEQAEADKSRLVSSDRSLLGEMEIKISGMSTTIQTLSARGGDMHTHLALVRQELEAEKLTVHHLRTDVQSYQNMLEVEQKKVSALRKEVQLAQANLESLEITGTLFNVPGVDPAKLIETMSGRLVHMQTEVASTKQLLAETQQAHSSGSSSSSSGGGGGGGGSERKFFMPTASVGKHAGAEFRTVVSEILSSSGSPSSSSADKFFEAMDSALLMQQLQSQELLLSKYARRVEELSELLVAADERKPSYEEETDRIGQESSNKQDALLKISLQEAEHEASGLRKENAKLKKTLSEIQIDDNLQRVRGATVSSSPSSRVPSPFRHTEHFQIEEFENKTMMMGQEDTEANGGLQEELASTKLLLAERTTQLKIVMETLDTLHLAGTRSNDENASPSANNAQMGMGGLASLASAPLPALDGSWSTQALIERIIQLTTELASQSANSSLEARRTEFAQKENVNNAKLINRCRTAIKQSEEERTKLLMQVELLTASAKDSENRRLAVSAAMQEENDSLMRSLRETDATLASLLVSMDELRQQTKLSDQEAVRSWLEEALPKAAYSSSSSHEPVMLLEHSSAASSSSNNNTNGGSGGSTDPGIHESITSLLSELREVSPVDLKSKEWFLQRVADLLLKANERSTQAVLAMRVAELKSKESALEASATMDRLKSCLLHVTHYRKRVRALERVTKIDSFHQTERKDEMVRLLRKNLAEERKRHEAAANVLLVERRDHKLRILQYSNNEKQLLFLQQRVADLESKGNSTLRGRDEAVAHLDSQLASVEERWQKWFKAELPRLLTGLPVTEDAMAASGSKIDDLLFASSSSSGPGILSSGGGVSIDKTFALAQSLCSTKAVCSAQELKLTSVLEKNSIMKLRIANLEGALYRWKNEIQTVSDLTHFGDGAGDSGGSGGAMGGGEGQGVIYRLHSEEVDIFAAAESEARLVERTQQLSRRIAELEEANVDLRGRFAHAYERSDELERFIEHMSDDKDKLAEARASFALHTSASSSSALAVANAAAVAAETKAAAALVELRSFQERHEEEVKSLKLALDRSSGSIAASLAHTHSHTHAHAHAHAHAPLSPSLQHRRHAEHSLTHTHTHAHTHARTHAHTHTNTHTHTKMLVEAGVNCDLLLPASSETTTKAAAIAVAAAAAGGGGGGGGTDEVERSTEMSRLEALTRNLQSALEVEQAQNNALRGKIQGMEQETAATFALLQQQQQQQREQEKQQQQQQQEPSLSRAPHIPFPQSTTAASTAAAAREDASSLLRALSSRVKLLEVDFSSSSSSSSGDAPYQNQQQQQRLSEEDEEEEEDKLTALRELNLRVVGLEQAMNRKIEWLSEEWKQERLLLTQEVQSKTELTLRQRTSHDETMRDVQQRYEEALTQTQEALEAQSEATEKEVSRLEELLKRSQELLEQGTHKHEADREQLLAKIGQLQDRISDLEAANLLPPSPPPLSAPPSTSTIQAPSPSQSQEMPSAAAAKASSAAAERGGGGGGVDLGELLKLQGLLEKATDELDAAQRRISELEESQGAAAAEGSASLSASASSSAAIVAAATAASEEAEEQLRRLDYRFRAKSAELDAIVRALSKAGGGSAGESKSPSTSVHQYSITASEDQAIDNSDNGSLPSEIRSDLFEARLGAAEAEVLSLQQLLVAERREGRALREQLAANNNTNNNHAHATTTVSGSSKKRVHQHHHSISDVSGEESGAGGASSSSSRARPISSSASAAAVAAVAAANRATEMELQGLRAQLADAKSQLSSIREEASKNQRLISSLRHARQSESKEAEQWQVEAKGHEETSKRLQRSIVSKEAIIRDLKARLEVAATAISEEQNMIPAPLQSSSAAATATAATNRDKNDAVLSLADLRSQLRLSEQERLRLRTRFIHLRDKLAETEQEVKVLREENESLSKNSDKFNALRVALARREAQCRSLKAQLDTTKAEAEVADRTSSSKIAQLHRQLDASSRAYKELERSMEPVPANIAETFLPRHQHQQSLSFHPSSASTVSPPLVVAPPPAVALPSRSSAPKASSSSPSSTAPTSAAMAIPTSLGSSTAKDVSDILASLGI